MASNFLFKIGSFGRRIARPSSSDAGSPTPPPQALSGDAGHGHAAAGGEEIDDESQYKEIDPVKGARSPPLVKAQVVLRRQQSTPQSQTPPKSSPERDPDEDENIVIGEYTQPVDALLPANLKSVPPSTPSDEDYSEPYESRKLLEELHVQALLTSKDVSEVPGASVYSDAYAVRDVPASVYDLAKDPSSAKQGGERLSRFSAHNRRNWVQSSASRGSSNLSRLTSASSEDKENTEADYDKLGYAYGYDRVDGASGESYSSLYEGSAFRPVRPQARPQGEVTYQDPWDRSTAEKDLEERLSSPKSRIHVDGNRSRVSSQDSENMNISKGTHEPVQGSGNYCQPWDLKATQQQFQDSLHSSRSPPSQDSPVKHSSPSASGAGGARSRTDSSGGKIAEGSLYDAPWDSEEKQRELAEKFKAAEIQKSPKKDGSKEGSPKSGVKSKAIEEITVYDEPWDISSKGRAISSMLSGSGEQKDGSAPKSPGKSAPNTSPKQKPAMKLDISARICSAIGEVIDPTIALDKQSWYHGSIGRSDAETLLRVCKEGSYLVRNSESTKTDFSLSMKSSRGFIHIKISRDKEHDRYILGENSQPFECIPEMIFHYSRNLLPIKGADHMILLHPVINELL